QAEDGIRDGHVTGVQTCALPICAKSIDIFFKTVSMEVYERPTFGFQATNEIVKELIHKGFIKAENVGQEIRLTSKGLDKCRENRSEERRVGKECRFKWSL